VAPTGIVGLGNRRAVLAANLVASGHAVVAHDVAGPGRPDGAAFVPDVATVARRADVVVLSLPAASEAVAFGRSVGLDLAALLAVLGASSGRSSADHRRAPRPRPDRPVRVRVRQLADGRGPPALPAGGEGRGRARHRRHPHLPHVEAATTLEDRSVAGTVDEPRLAPLPPAEWPPEMKGALAALRVPNPRHPYPRRDPDRPKGLNALGLLARHPELTTAFHHLTGHLLFGTTLSPLARELLVLRVAAVRGAEYEWVQHVVLAGDAGLTGEDIDRVAEGPQAEGWSPFDGALVAAVDELLADARIEDATWKVLAAELDDRQLMDLVFTVGAYDLLAMAFRTFEVPLDADLEEWRDRR
jgi:4-carboxymuconolactone decarboxylase